MKFSLDSSAANTILAYDVGMLRVHQRGNPESSAPAANIRHITSSVIITPDKLIDNWSPKVPTELSVEHMRPVLAFEPEVVILGTGRRLCFPGTEVIQTCHRVGAGFEVMDTGAACRTYNILASEGRRVVAALLMIETQAD